MSSQGLRQPHVQFRNPHLATVLAQLRYPVLPSFSNPDLIDKFFQAVRVEYPRSNRNVTFTSVGLGELPVQNVPNAVQWRFSAEDGRWALILTETALTIETRSYSQFVELLDRFSNAIRVLEQVYNPTLQVRLGLRFVNEFRVAQATSVSEWSKYLKSDLLGFPLIIPQVFPDAHVQFARQELELSMPDGSLVIRHGLHTGTSVEPQEGLISSLEPVDPQTSFYLLDMDRSSQAACKISVPTVRNQLQEFDDQVDLVFRWALQPSLITILDPMQ